MLQLLQNVLPGDWSMEMTGYRVAAYGAAVNLFLFYSYMKSGFISPRFAATPRSDHAGVCGGALLSRQLPGGIPKRTTPRQAKP